MGCSTYNAVLFVYFYSMVVLLIYLIDAAQWGYPNMESTEVKFPKWGGLCDNGRYQSPINLNIHESLVGDFSQFQFVNYATNQKALIVNNGHTVQISSFPQKMKLAGGPLSDEYFVEQLHFHWWSEHTISNIRYPLECHIVHMNKRYNNFTQAAMSKDGIVVLSILYHVSNSPPNDGVAKVLKYIENIKDYDKIDNQVQMEDFVVSDLFPEIKGYFTYDGSLTTPMCAESVTWIVIQATFPVSLHIVEQFQQIETAKDKRLENNFRFTQKRYNRPVVTVAYSSSIGLRISLITLLAAEFVRFLI